MYKADQGDYIVEIIFNGFVISINPYTKRKDRVCLINLKLEKSIFTNLNLQNIGKHLCLLNLDGQISSKPEELLPIHPIIIKDKNTRNFIKTNMSI